MQGTCLTHADACYRHISRELCLWKVHLLHMGICEIGENNTCLCTDHVPQVYIPCRIPCSSLVQYSPTVLSLLATQQTLNFKNEATSYQGTLVLPHCCCPSFVATRQCEQIVSRYQ